MTLDSTTHEDRRTELLKVQSIVADIEKCLLSNGFFVEEIALGVTPNRGGSAPRAPLDWNWSRHIDEEEREQFRVIHPVGEPWQFMFFRWNKADAKRSVETGDPYYFYVHRRRVLLEDWHDLLTRETSLN